MRYHRRPYPRERNRRWRRRSPRYKRRTCDPCWRWLDWRWRRCTDHRRPNCRHTRTHGWMRRSRQSSNRGWPYWSSGKSRARRRVHWSMWDHLRSHQLLWRNFHHVIGHAHTAPENFRWHYRGRDSLVRVMHIVDVPDVDDVLDVGYVTHVGDVDDSQVIAAVVIPREERLRGSQWKPADKVHIHADRKTWPTDERHQSRRKHRHGNDGSGIHPHAPPTNTHRP